LQLGVYPRLLLQQAVRILTAGRQCGFKIEQVRRRLEQSAGQLLQQGMTVHFQRVEFVVSHAIGFSVRAAVQATLGFAVEPTQLILHPLEGGLHLVEGHLPIVDLLLHPPTNDRGFTRQVDQVFQQFGWHLEGVQPRALAFGHRQRRRLRLGHRARRLPGVALNLANLLDQRLGRRQWLATAQCIEHLRQLVVATLQQYKQFSTGHQKAHRNIFEEGLKFVSKVANDGDLDHARATFQGVQITQQVFHFKMVLRVRLPA